MDDLKAGGQTNTAATRRRLEDGRQEAETHPPEERQRTSRTRVES